MKYYVFWNKIDGREEGMSDEPYDTREEAQAAIKEMQADDVENGEKGAWEYRIETDSEEEDESDDDWECGDHPDDRGVVVAGRGGNRVRRFASSYAREMWEIGMRESDFC